MADDLPAGYPLLLAELKTEIRSARLRASRVVNTELLRLYWTVGSLIRRRRAAKGWGARVTDRLAADLRREFPDLRGFSPRNLRYMATAAGAWPEPIGQQPVAQLPWGHVTVLLDKLHDQDERDWYAAKAAEHGWSRDVLRLQISGRLRDRLGAAPSNFASQLAGGDSDLAQQLTKHPYVFEFLDLTERKRERGVEQALMDRLQETLLEFGRGFAFVGRQVHFDIDGDDFYADLVLFHVEQLRYVVVELKVGRFRPEYAGQLGFYVAVVDDRLRRSDRHGPTVGILLCASRNDSVVRYALAGTSVPLAVANFADQVDPDPAGLHLPAPQELTAILDEPFPGQPGHTLAEALPAEEEEEEEEEAGPDG